MRVRFTEYDENWNAKETMSVYFGTAREAENELTACGFVPEGHGRWHKHFYGRRDGWRFAGARIAQEM